jgi:XTP/dITP diphosphohydrolase
MDLESPMIELLIATRNPGKRSEMQTLLAGLDVEVLTLESFPEAPEVAEDGDTLAENAVQKATEVARACGVFTVADDSGLFVDALEGRPGVLSARYAGPDPTSEKLCRKLLWEMQGVPDERRGAHFACCIALARPDGSVAVTTTGRVDGRITEGMQGTGGFGYDPVFFHVESGCTFAQMQQEAKNAISHRGRALSRFGVRFARFLREGGL